MNTLKAALLGIGGLFLLESATALAFHTEGADECEGCHINHRKEPSSGSAFASSAAGGSAMLSGSDSSSTCLNCHGEKMKVLSKDGSAYAPGGDFFWLTRSYRAEDGRSAGENHGHNVVSQDYRLQEDTIRVVAPSDGSVSYQSRWLSCTSCHDPHAKSRGSSSLPADGGNYRLLGGVGYEGGGLAVGISFTNSAPFAKAYPARDGHLPPENNRNHNVYGSGMSEWCANCHSGLAGSGQHRHPAGNDAKMGILAQLYDSYVSSGNMEGTHESAYDFLVPFEHGTDDPGSISTSSTEGPSAGSNVMCLSCHRAHASPFSSSGRWDFNSTLLAESAVLSSPEGKHAYYGEDITRRYVASQRSLCNKCHVKD